MRTFLALPAVALVLVLTGACSSDDGGDRVATDTTTAAATDTIANDSGGGSFCDAAGRFAVASAEAPDAAPGDEVEETVNAMAAAAAEVAATAPDSVTADAEAFAEAVAGLEQYAADRDFDVDLGAAAPEYQSGEGQAVVDAINGTIAPVDQAVQDECDRFLNEVP